MIITRKGVLLTSIAGEYALIAAAHLRKEVPYVMTLNETGAFCWQLLTEGSDEDSLTKAILEEFEVEDENLVRNDVHALLTQLRERHYLEVI